MTQELQTAAQTACEQIGVIFQAVNADGLFHPLDIEGKATRNGAGRIKVYTDGEGGQVWNHITGDTLQFWTKSDHAFTPAEQEDRKSRAKAERPRPSRERTCTEKKDGCRDYQSRCSGCTTTGRKFVFEAKTGRTDRDCSGNNA